MLHAASAADGGLAGPGWSTGVGAGRRADHRLVRDPAAGCAPSSAHPARRAAGVGRTSRRRPMRWPVLRAGGAERAARARWRSPTASAERLGLRSRSACRRFRGRTSAPRPLLPLAALVLGAGAGLGAVAPGRRRATRPDALGPLRPAFANAFWLDAVQDALVVRPVRGAGPAVRSIADERVVDGAVEGTGQGTRRPRRRAGRAGTGPGCPGPPPRVLGRRAAARRRRRDLRECADERGVCWSRCSALPALGAVAAAAAAPTGPAGSSAPAFAALAFVAGLLLGASSQPDSWFAYARPVGAPPIAPWARARRAVGAGPRPALPPRRRRHLVPAGRADRAADAAVLRSTRCGTCPTGGRGPTLVALLLVLEVGILGTFLALDLVLFFVFFEVVLLPMYAIIAGWGGAGPAARGPQVRALHAVRLGAAAGRRVHRGRGGRHRRPGDAHLGRGRPVPRHPAAPRSRCWRSRSR